MSKRKSIIYISGGYHSHSPQEKNDNIERVEKYTLALWEKGFVVICPRLNAFLFDETRSNPDVFRSRYLTVMERCDLVFFIPLWAQSRRSIAEMEHCLSKDIPFAFSVETVSAFTDHLRALKEIKDSQENQ